MGIIFPARWVFIAVFDDEYTNVRNGGYDGGCNVSCAFLIGDMTEEHLGGLMNTLYSWNTLVTWDRGDDGLKSKVLQGTGCCAEHTRREVLAR